MLLQCNFSSQESAAESNTVTANQIEAFQQLAKERKSVELMV